MLDVYAAAMDPPNEQLPGRHTIMERHASYPGFRALVVERRGALPVVPGPVLGFAYGFHGTRGQWWHDVVHQALSDLEGPSTPKRGWRTRSRSPSCTSTRGRRAGASAGAC